ncbi:MAG TPA: hypothetical protein VHL11_21530 [Phototrophicaceae bacterium]|jgi:hypothetical protein|nr:hypothetical protein [Phototrophicaceae bacterium]
MTDRPLQDNWVTVSEAAEITGYNRNYIKRLATKLWKLPEEEREIRLLRAPFGYTLWLPDLLEYKDKPARGPYQKRKSSPIT